MRTTALAWKTTGELAQEIGNLTSKPDLLLFFASRSALCDAYVDLRQHLPDTTLLGCSTGGQFQSTEIEDDRNVGLAIGFDTAQCRLATVDVKAIGGSFLAGSMLGQSLVGPELKAIFVLSEGLGVNGSELVAGLTHAVGKGVILTGGLAGDGSKFEKTLIAANAPAQSDTIAALGLYGDSLEISSGSAGGWDPFGPRRTITRASGNVLYELDGKLALDLYERYLGEEEIAALPGSALLFPLKIRDPKNADSDVVRTVLAVDRELRSMTFAGDMPTGWSAELMRGNFDRLAEGAAQAAQQTLGEDESDEDGLDDGFAVLVSCIGRRLLMGQRASDEIEAAASAYPRKPAMIGFYSYGEISPHAKSGFCQLHNQTMTVLRVRERREVLRDAA